MNDQIPVGQLLEDDGLGNSCGGGIHGSLFEKIISPENIFAAWREFQKGKMRKADVLAFAERAEEHLLDLVADLRVLHHGRGSGTYFLPKKNAPDPLTP